MYNKNSLFAVLDKNTLLAPLDKNTGNSTMPILDNNIGMKIDMDTAKNKALDNKALKNNTLVNKAIGNNSSNSKTLENKSSENKLIGKVQVGTGLDALNIKIQSMDDLKKLEEGFVKAYQEVKGDTNLTFDDFAKEYFIPQDVNAEVYSNYEGIKNDDDRMGILPVEYYKTYFCKDCLSHTVCKKEDEILCCSKCGGKNIKDYEYSFVPLKLGQLKKMDTLEIYESEFEKYKNKIENYDSLDFEWFMNNGVVKIVCENKIYYVRYKTLNEKRIHTSVYIHDTMNNRFYFDTSNTYEKDGNRIGYGIPFINDVVYESFELNGGILEHDNESKKLIKMVMNTHKIFKLLSQRREIEDISVEVDDTKTKETQKRNGTTKIQKRRIIYITDKIKIYTYDSSMASKLRNHKPIELPVWKVNGFKRRVFVKEDRDLPKDQRRIVKISDVPSFLKGKERDKYSVEEFGTTYRIAR